MNPYESPKPTDLAKRQNKVSSRIGLAIVLGLFALPVAIIAGLMTYMAGDLVAPRSETPGFAGVLAAAAAGTKMIHLAFCAAIP